MLVDGIEFSFPPDWEFEKYDDWVFYKNQFQSVGEGQKAVDIVARDPQKTLWFIVMEEDGKPGVRRALSRCRRGV
jgi:hypothetical protein